MQIEQDVFKQLDNEQQLYLPGDLVADQVGLISGSNTYEEEGKIYASTTGTVVQTNKLLMIKPIKHSYEPQIGEIVIGRVQQIRDKRWVVDIGSGSEATLHLNSTYLPEQRQKTEDDEMNMRYLLAEHDLVCAEVHSINNDKSVNLHTRSLKYGRLEDGRIFQVCHYLIVKQKKHFFKLDNGIDIIFGHNGLLFMSNQDRISSNTTVTYSQQYTVRQRVSIAMTCRALNLLNQKQIRISQGNLQKAIEFLNNKLTDEQCAQKMKLYLLEQKENKQ